MHEKKKKSIIHRAKGLLLPRGYNSLPPNLTPSKVATVVGFRDYSAFTLLPFYSVGKQNETGGALLHTDGGRRGGEGGGGGIWKLHLHKK